MAIKQSLLIGIASLLLIPMPSAFAKEYVSLSTATEIIELYTSEGCSSCPPADKWLRQLKADPGLFKNFIPLAFHVDYWDRLGWTDRFASNAFSNRQYRHKTEGNIAQVYTPGFVVNNKEWRGWFNGHYQWSEMQKEVGVLTAENKQDSSLIDVSYAPEINIDGDSLLVNIAILGMNLSTHVKSGENGGRQLQHDFVVLSHHQEVVRLSGDATQKWQLAMPEVLGNSQNALVVWLSYPQSQQVIQAVGGYL